MSLKTNLTATLLGLTSLGLQFVFNRLIFFYIVNTDYATVSVVSLHLSGFLAGALLAGRFKKIPFTFVLAAYPLLVATAYMLTWRFGVDFLPIVAVLGLLGFFAFLVALSSGFIIACLMKAQKDKDQATAIIIADTAGSVIGAVITGFWLLPIVGLGHSFLIFIGLSAVLSLMHMGLAAKPILIGAAGALLLLVFPAQFFRHSNALQRVEGFPLSWVSAQGNDVLTTAQSPFGVISVIQEKHVPHRILSIDDIGLCGVDLDGNDLEKHNSWQMGQYSAALVAKKRTKPRVAIVGLGCGLTLAAALTNLPPQASIDMIEVNPEMPKMTKLFTPITGDGLSDPRVHLEIEDGFKHFMQGNLHPDSYDLVIVDIVWMRDAMLTHMFSEEFFQKVRESLAPDGVFTLWVGMGDENDPVMQTVYATLQASFPYIGVRQVANSYTYSASGDQDVLDSLPPDQELTTILRMKSAGAPLNTLDHLVLNHLIFGPNAGTYSFHRYQ